MTKRPQQANTASLVRSYAFLLARMHLPYSALSARDAEKGTREGRQEGRFKRMATTYGFQHHLLLTRIKSNATVYLKIWAGF